MIRAFVAEIFAKWYQLSKMIDFYSIFHIFTVARLKSLLTWRITEWLWNCLEIKYQNVPIHGKSTPVLGCGLLPGLGNE